MKRLTLVLIILGLIAVSIYFFRAGKVTEGIVGLGLSILALFITIWLQYPGYKAAEEARVPVASLELIEKPRFLPREYEAQLHNNCDQAIQANFNLSITMWGRVLPVKAEIFKGPIVINPHDSKTVCRFDVARIIVDHYPYSYDQLESDERANPDHAIVRLNIEAQEKPEQADKILRFKMTISYFGLRSKEKGIPIYDEHFYDFDKRTMSDPVVRSEV